MFTEKEVLCKLQNPFQILFSFLLRYARMSDLPLFSPLSKTKSRYMMRSSRLSYSRFQELFKEALSELVCDPKVRSMACIVYTRVGLLQP